MNNHRRDATILALALWLTACALLYSSAPSRTPFATRSYTSTLALLAAPAAAQFSRALVPRRLEFPRDHGAHESFRTEWWYFTGHLKSTTAEEFGFQLTLFRFELDADAHASQSAWRTPRVMLGHFAVSDLNAGQFHAYERLSRALPGIAGVASDPPKVSLDDWQIDFDPTTKQQSWQVVAAQQGTRLALQLSATSPIVAQGEAGLSRKGALPGNASYYYSVPRLRTTGTLTIGDRELEVTGSAWLDREWSTSALDADQQGWDWFALQLDDQSTLMYYRLRRVDGRDDPHSAGSFVDAAGNITLLSAADVEISVQRHWHSPATGVDYPAAWHIEVASLGLSLQLRSRLADQEWRQRFRYWEGVVALSGSSAAGPLSGRGYVELTGY